ncbi:hypothetical protein C8Q77DRAFT_1112281 [Trametes polyzona]|nr:hypothetical protein C8Q77DRAFT_1112281 [Trametes polyzona]
MRLLCVASLTVAALVTTCVGQSACTIDTPSPPRQCTFAVLEWSGCSLPVTLVSNNLFSVYFCYTATLPIGYIGVPFWQSC